MAAWPTRTPAGDREFAANTAGLGDIAGDAPTEVAVGAAGGARPGTVHIGSACASTVLRTIGDPNGESGAGFGTAIAPLGDRNSDGFLDFAVGAPRSTGSAGRVYVFTSSGPAADGFAGCGGGGGGGGGGSGGSGGAAPRGKTPADDNEPRVRGRVLRRLTLAPSRRTVAWGSPLSLKGALRTSGRQASCQRRQKIAIQRRKLKGGRFQTFDVAITARNGRFTVKTWPGRSYLFRARVSQTQRCTGARSKATKVMVHR